MSALKAFSWISIQKQHNIQNKAILLAICNVIFLKLFTLYNLCTWTVIKNLKKSCWNGENIQPWQPNVSFHFSSMKHLAMILLCCEAAGCFLSSGSSDSESSLATFNSTPHTAVSTQLFICFTSISHSKPLKKKIYSFTSDCRKVDYLKLQNQGFNLICSKASPVNKNIMRAAEVPAVVVSSREERGFWEFWN